MPLHATGYKPKGGGGSEGSNVRGEGSLLPGGARAGI